MAEKIKVLMVDDEARFRNTTAKILQKRGFEVTMAESGASALETLKEAPMDVVVLDVKMPGMDGHEVLARIREMRPETQVIMLTGHGDPVSAELSLQRGACDYLNKPCDIDILSAKINYAYKRRHQADNGQMEKKARDIMIHISDYTTISENAFVEEAFVRLMKSFEGLAASQRIMETGHRSILVFDAENELCGLLTIQDLIAASRPDYLSAPKPSMADAMQYSPMFWAGLFTSRVKSVARKKVFEVMSESPPSVDEDANLMEIADFMFTRKRRRVLVTSKNQVIGIVREQEVFFEMVNIVLSGVQSTDG